MENGLINLINHLNPSNYCHHIFCLKSTGIFEKRIKNNNCKIVELNKKDGNDFSIPIALMKHFKKDNIDIVHLRGWPTLIEGIIAAKLCAIKRIIYGFHGRLMEDTNGLSLKRKIGEKFALKCVPFILTLNEQMGQQMYREFGLSKDKIHIIYNGVDTEKFFPNKRNKKIINEFNLYDEDFVLGFAGRLDAVKDLKTSIIAFSHFVKQNVNSKMIIIGDGPEREKLLNLVEKHKLGKHIFITGYRNDVPKLLNLIDVYIQTSLYEGFSNTILEAMSTGLPIIATNVGGNSTLIQNGINGYIIPKQEPEILNKKLKILKNDYELRNRMKSNNIKAVNERYSLRKMIDEYDRFYSKVAKKS